MRRRPDTIPGLLVLLVRRRLNVPTVVLTALVLLVAFAVLFALLTGPPTVKIATFNIQDYPKNPTQAAGAVELIGDLDVQVAAVQEITDTDTFDRNVDDYLGDHWNTAYVKQKRPSRRVAVVYNDDELELLDTTTHRDTVIKPGASRATLEAKFRTRYGAEPRTFRLFVVHLAAHDHHREVRRKQIEALKPLVTDAVDDGHDVNVLGDFNTTGVADFYQLQKLVDAANLHWPSLDLPCTVYWDREDLCATSNLDHILSTQPAQSIHVGGACKTVGCDVRAECPTYVEHISDHCPVVTEL